MKLLEPMTLRGVEFANRIWIPPMCMYSANDGVVGNFHIQHLGSLAAGGAGLVIAEATGIVPEGRISVGCAGIWDDKTAEAWRPAVEMVHELGGKVAIQLAHAGRKGSRNREWDGGGAEIGAGGWQPVGPTDEAYPGYAQPRALTVTEIRGLVEAWAAAAKRAVAVGFDAVELHAAHGYLLHEFLSPLVNTRTDQYGGDLAGRARFVLEVAEAVRAAVDVPLLVRLSATDWAEGGWDLEQSVWLCRELGNRGVDFIDVSTGGAVQQQNVPAGPHFQVPFAATIRLETGLPTGAVGLITEPAAAEKLLQNGEADVVLVGRAALRNPHWPWFAVESLGGSMPNVPRQYRRGRLVQ